jgi:hypothetical protein
MAVGVTITDEKEGCEAMCGAGQEAYRRTVRL